MALFIILLSSISGIIVALISLAFFGASWAFAAVIYFIAATLPAISILVVMYINILISYTFYPERRAEMATARH